MKLLVTDGGKRSGITYGSFKVFDDDGNELKHRQFVIGYGTSNQAEYIALRNGLTWCMKNNIKNVKVFLDSDLVYNHLVNGWRCNYNHLCIERNHIFEMMNFFNDLRLEKVSHKLIKGYLGH